MWERQFISSHGEHVPVQDAPTGGLEKDGSEQAQRQLQLSMRACASEYAVVAVVGSQSSGKSTLLNDVFGTQFPVLDAPLHGRRRTTQGVWLAYSPLQNLQHRQRASSTPSSGGASSMRRDSTDDSYRVSNRYAVVLDIEGTDSRERGELEASSKVFESCTTLFALAVCDVVLLNVWFHDLGRYQASNFELLQVVFREALRLERANKVRFQPLAPRVPRTEAGERMGGEEALDSAATSTRVATPVTQIVIVVRDVDMDASEDEVQRAVLTDVQAIWDAVDTTLPLSHLFDVRVVMLQHRMYCRDAYDQDAKALLSHITGILESGSVTRPVPLDGFEPFAVSVWETVRESMAASSGSQVVSIDLPDLALLAAQYRCEEYLKAAQSSMNEDFEKLETRLFESWASPPPDFGELAERMCNHAFQVYDDNTQAYRSSAPALAQTCDSKREQLRLTLSDRFLSLHEQYTACCRNAVESDFDSEFGLVVGGSQDFERTSKRIAMKHEAAFEVWMKSARAPAVLKCEIDVAQRAIQGFHAHVQAQIDERRATGLAMLPVSADGHPITAQSVLNGGRRKVPWWRSMLIKVAIIAFNYWQATRAQRDARRVQRVHEEQNPITPYF
ncbi:Protein SEY1-like [Porphyridium purpureum]|uniref:Protein SEY1-like n=1 Tax=Porphyridium purpureum TaxID=35688 RepID=A0A5J4YXG9_PORPP|nr:Protein SEY1-like [Porphyridium purpureum]|eukprot:POR1713..scf209_3